MAYLTPMKKLLTWPALILQFVSLLASTQPVVAEGGIIGTPPVPPEPGTPTLLYSGCGGEVVSPRIQLMSSRSLTLSTRNAPAVA